MMATQASDDGMEPDQGMPSADEIQGMMVAKAHELFAVCDKEEKGFITKRDMQRLQTELPLSPEQLESVFDSLDDDGNGFLTLEEFTGGFGSFLGMTPTVEKQESLNSSHGSEKVYENEHVNSEDEEENFNEMIDNVGAGGVFDDIEVIKNIWAKIRRDEPELLVNFEEFLGRVTGEIKRSHTDITSLESALRHKSVSHDEEVRKLYEEMEQQIRTEKERILAEEKGRERQLREEMERELIEKERLLREVLRKQQEMEEKLTSQNSQDFDIKQENDRLMKEKEELERLLEQTQVNLDESRSYINTLRQKQRDEKRERAMAALQISEGIAMERESLVKQLDMLRDMNKKLRDDRDEKELQRKENKRVYVRSKVKKKTRRANKAERASNYYTGGMGEEGDEEDIEEDAVDAADAEASPAASASPPGRASSPRQQSRDEESSSSEAPHSAHKNRRKQLAKQGSILSNYFGSGPRGFSDSSLQPSLEEDDEIETDDVDAFDPHSNNNNSKIDAELITKSEAENLATSPSGNLEYGADNTGVAMMKRGEPVGANSSVEVREPPLDPSKMTPERVFKIVFIGDSGVGKSSFIHRFCNDSFKEAFSATIGVDFQVKNLIVDDHLIALQLWDTAGQERFRSITKQYFRKADGVLVMYDCNSEVSFTNVRNWVGSVQEGVEEGTVLVLVGNKTDLCEEEEQRIVKTKDGAKMADEYGALFYETSAKNGSNVTEALRDMASLLREREDREMEKALSLKDGDGKKKGGCCS